MKPIQNRRDFLKNATVGLGGGFFALNNLEKLFAQDKKDLPNILWIVSEDNSASYLGCYGNEQATTPNLDRLAKEGIQFQNAFANIFSEIEWMKPMI